MADRLARLVPDRQVGERGFDPGRGLIGSRENAAAFRLADSLDDRAGQLHVAAGDEADLVGESGAGIAVWAAGAVNERGLADDDVVAGLEGRFLDALVVD